FPRCVYGCTRDEECPASNICVCGDPVGHCAPATCTTDRDCGGASQVGFLVGFLCASYKPDHYCGVDSFACQAWTDSCLSDRDCTNGLACTLQGTRRACSAIQVCF